MQRSPICISKTINKFSIPLLITQGSPKQAARFSMPFTKANDLNIYYEIHGQGSPLILIEGLAQHHLSWKDFIKPLAKHFKVIVFDNRGCGETEVSEFPYSIKMMADDVSALMENLHIESADFIGGSMGSAIVLQLCLDHPEKVRKGFLCAPFAHLPPVAKMHLQTIMKLLETGIHRDVLLELQAAVLLSNGFLAKEGNLRKFLQEGLSDPHPAEVPGILGQCDALMLLDLREKLPLIPHELFLLVGEQDILTPPFCAKEINEKVGQSTLHILKGMGHFFWYEIPEKIIKFALRFFFKE